MKDHEKYENLIRKVALISENAAFYLEHDATMKKNFKPDKIYVGKKKYKQSRLSRMGRGEQIKMKSGERLYFLEAWA